MEKLVNEIVALFNPKGKVEKKLYRGVIGFGISTLFFLIFVKGLLILLDVTQNATLISQEIVSIACSVVFLVVVLIYCYYFVLYIALLLITLIQYGFTPHYNNYEQSIEAIMTSEVEDTRRLHKAIIAYLKEHSAPRDFAALYIWLDKNHLLRTNDQKRFLEVLKTDFPDLNASDIEKIQTHVPAPSSFSEQKTILEKDNRKEYEEGGFDLMLQKRFRSFIKD